jgi:hypothetical protein
MLMNKRVVLTLVAALIVGLVSWSLFPGEIKTDCEYYEYTYTKYCTAHKIPAIFWRQTGDFVETHNGAIAALAGIITAIATAFIGRFTFILKRSTDSLRESSDKLWDASERQLEHLKESAERQLGAYIGVSEGRIVSYDWGNTFVAEITIKNTGQTPAYQVTHYISATSRDRGTIESFNMPAKKPQKWVMAPSASWKLAQNIGPINVGTIQQGQREIFVWGHVDYFDVFDKPQWLEFRLRNEREERQAIGATSKVVTIGWELEPCEDGNDSS